MNRLLAATLGSIVALPFVAGAATISIDSDAHSYGLGDTFIATVRLDNGDECINAAQIDLSYPAKDLRAVDFSRGDSIFSLWVADPVLNTAKGTVSFSGGVPGGYCGRIQGDPAQSNILGKVVFTVVSASDTQATIALNPSSKVYLHDGLGTPAQLALAGLSLALGPTPTLATNPWIDAVKSDTVSPDTFAVQVESTRGVFGGKYYAVFSTTDKQSGIDHYEIYEDGVWKHVTSPYLLHDQSLDGGVRLRAIDKAGNIRVADFDPKSVPARQYSTTEFASLVLLILIAIAAVLIRLYFARERKRLTTPAA